MSHPLTACISEIGFLQERIREQTARIEALEAALEASDTLGKYWQARAIEALGIPAALAEEQEK